MGAGAGEPLSASSKAERVRQIYQRIEQLGRLLRGEERINVRAVLESVERGRVIAPVYDRFGRRTDTPLQRAKKYLFSERNELAFEAFDLDPDFKLPESCPPPRLERKVYFPVEKYPQVNFAGLVLGPRGVTQKRIESRFGCRLLIRGRGARSRDAGDDALHARIEAVGPDAPQRVEACAKYLEEEILIPRKDEENVLKVAQLRELAMMNGTLREDAKIARLAAQRARDAAIAQRQQIAPPADRLEHEVDAFLKDVDASIEKNDEGLVTRSLSSGVTLEATEARAHSPTKSFQKTDALLASAPTSETACSAQRRAFGRDDGGPRKRLRPGAHNFTKVSDNSSLR
jgi:hypothetical protein